jgi:hypothetical protein
LPLLSILGITKLLAVYSLCEVIVAVFEIGFVEISRKPETYPSQSVPLRLPVYSLLQLVNTNEEAIPPPIRATEIGNNVFNNIFLAIKVIITKKKKKEWVQVKVSLN